MVRVLRFGRNREGRRRKMRGEEGKPYKFDAVTFPVEVFEGSTDGGQNRTFPWTNIFLENSCHEIDGVKVEIATDLPVLGKMLADEGV